MQGEESRSMFVISKGLAEVSIIDWDARTVSKAPLPEGESFGELCALNMIFVSDVTVVAKTELVELFVINLEDMVRSRRFEVLRRLHAIEATRVHQTRPGVVSISMLRPFGPRRGRRGVSERERSGRRREVARTDAVAAKASARCRMRVYTPRECTEAVS